MNLADFILDGLITSIFEPANIDDHINFRSAVCDGILGLIDFDSSGMITVWETNHRADGQFAGYIIRSLLDIGGRDARRGGAVGDAIVKNLADFIPCGSLCEERVVHGL